MFPRFSLATVLLVVLAVGWVDTIQAEKGTRFNLPERPGGCFAQIKPGPFFGPIQAAPLDAEIVKAALRTGTPAQDEFVEAVVALTNAGALPRKIVEGTYYWAMRKKERLRFQYFKRALIVRLSRAGIKLQL